MSEDMPVDKHTMDDINIALCYYYRNHPDGSKPMKYVKICEKVRLGDERHKPPPATS